MRRHPVVPSAIAALVLLAVPATASADSVIFDRSARVSVELVPASDGTVYAVATLESRLRLRLRGQAELRINGNQVLLGDVETSGQLILVEPLGNALELASVCVRFEGLLEAPDDSLRPIELEDCAGKSSRPSPVIDDGPVISSRLGSVTRLQRPR